MSYQVLARKWRPRTFREMVGQQHVLQALINALDHDRLHHAYLFTGTRGVGKTTIARILAKCLNCETGVSSEPCGQCASCIEIAEGRFVDLIEVDAASRTKVEDTRELLENVQYSPTRGRYKVYLIDEVHMLSSHSFNALLKTLEEPPPHVKFLLATTDPQKLPVTILSRCLQFHLKNMEPQKIVEHLAHVLDKEMVDFEEPALFQIARSADGSMRDAMSLTDQAIAFGGGRVAESDVNAMLGAVDHKLVLQILSSLAQQDTPALMSAIETLSEYAPDYSSVLSELLSVLHRIAVGQALPAAVDNRSGDRESLLKLAAVIPPETVQLFYQTALMGRRDLPLSPDQRMGFEMVLLRMLAFCPQGVHSVPTKPLPSAESSSQNTVSGPPADLEGLSISGHRAPVEAPTATSEQMSQPAKERHSSPKTPIAPADSPTEVVSNEPEIQSRAATPVAENSGAVEERVIESTPTENSVSHENAGSARGLTADQLTAMGLTSGRQIPTPASSEEVDPEPVANPVISDQVIGLEDFGPADWIGVYAKLNVSGVLQSTVANCELVGKDGNRLMFMLDEHNASLFDESHQSRMAGLLTDYFGEPVQVMISLGQIANETPAGFTIRLRQERHDETLLAMKNDPLVQQLIQQFDATIDESSVRPADD